ncbi:MAG: hypothetical protein ACLPWS_16550 [Rhodomicrobium sp.]
MPIVERNAAAILDAVERAYLIGNGRVVMGGTAAEPKQNPDIKAFDLGGAGVRDYTQVKNFRRRKRWLSQRRAQAAQPLAAPSACGPLPPFGAMAVAAPGPKRYKSKELSAAS